MTMTVARITMKYFNSLCSTLLQAASAVLLLAAVTAGADTPGFEQHHAHEHGKVIMNAAVDGPGFLLELDAPAVNVVGFEHPPATARERAAVRGIAAYLRAGHGLIGVPPAADCHFISTDLTEPKWEATAQPAVAHPEDQHARAPHEEHADYEARFTYRCAHAELLSWFEPWLLRKLLHVTEARINLITPAGQRSESVNDARARILLQ
jgi:hypothetical protein